MAGKSSYQLVPDIPDDLLQQYLKESEIAVDTELQGLRLGRDQVCLVQLCDRKGRVCLVQPVSRKAPPNLKKLFTHPGTIKVFHYALTDVAFLRTSLDIHVTPYCCTKVMSKLIRTYTGQHGLKHLVLEFVGVDMDKYSQTSNWHKKNLTSKQLEYAAGDVLYLLKVYDKLKEMLVDRGDFPTGISAVQLNEKLQNHLPTLVELIINGFGDVDQGWDTSIFSH